jgi:hypothetical protein
MEQDTEHTGHALTVIILSGAYSSIPFCINHYCLGVERDFISPIIIVLAAKF